MREKPWEAYRKLWKLMHDDAIDHSDYFMSILIPASILAGFEPLNQRSAITR